MKLTSKFVIIVLLIAIVPITVGLALTQQKIQQFAQTTTTTLTPPPGCYYQQPGACPKDCIAGQPCPPPCNPVLICLSPFPALHCADCRQNNKNTLCLNSAEKSAYCTNSQQVNQPSLNLTCVKCCIPRPPCLDATPFHCNIAIPPGELCPPSPTPSPILTPPTGCYYQHRECPNCTVVGHPELCSCPPPILVCPSLTPTVCGSNGIQMKSFNPTDNSITQCVTPTLAVSTQPLPSTATGNSTSPSFWTSFTSFFQNLFHP